MATRTDTYEINGKQIPKRILLGSLSRPVGCSGLVGSIPLEAFTRPDWLEDAFNDSANNPTGDTDGPGTEKVKQLIKNQGGIDRVYNDAWCDIEQQYGLDRYTVIAYLRSIGVTYQSKSATD